MEVDSKTDLKKIMNISGHSGLYRYIAQTRNGVIVESLIDKKRTAMSSTTRISSLSDVYVYTDGDEIKLQAIFDKMKEHLAGAEAPSSKADGEELKAFFKTVVPNYDQDRFYVSHMRKVVDWYSQLKQYATLDFEVDEQRDAMVKMAHDMKKAKEQAKEEKKKDK